MNYNYEILTNMKMFEVCLESKDTSHVGR